jgi:hypothetical protein
LPAYHKPALLPPAASSPEPLPWLAAPAERVPELVPVPELLALVPVPVRMRAGLGMDSGC